MIRVPKIVEVSTGKDYVLIVRFADNTVKRLDMAQYFDWFKPFKPLEDKAVFELAHACKYGSAVIWNDEIDLGRQEIWKYGE